MLKKAIAQATGVNVAHINAEYKKAGDLGLVAMVCILSKPRFLLYLELS